MTIGKSKILRPTYTTEFSPDYDNAAAVVSIAAIETESSLPGESKTMHKVLRGSDRSEVVTLTEWGCISVFSVNEIDEANMVAEKDWGLRIGAPLAPLFLFPQSRL